MGLKNFEGFQPVWFQVSRFPDLMHLPAANTVNRPGF